MNTLCTSIFLIMPKHCKVKISAAHTANLFTEQRSGRADDSKFIVADAWIACARNLKQTATNPSTL